MAIDLHPIDIIKRAAQFDPDILTLAFRTEVVNSTALPVSFSGPGTAVVANVSVAAIDTEYSYTFPDNTKKFTLRGRSGLNLKISYTSGQSGTTYIELPSGNSLDESGIDTGSGFKIYFQSFNTGTVEIVSWS